MLLILVVGCINSFQLLLVPFESLRIVKTFSEDEKCKYLFFTATRIHTIAPIVKKRNSSIFSSLVTQTCKLCFSSTVRNGKILQASLFNLH